MKYIREQVVEAKGMPSKEAIVRRLNFCQWTDVESPWISREVWKGAEREYDIKPAGADARWPVLTFPARPT